MQGNDRVLEMRSQEQIPISGGGVGGTCSSQDSSCSGSTVAKREKATTSLAWEYFEVKWKVELDGMRRKMAKCKFCAKL